VENFYGMWVTSCVFGANSICLRVFTKARLCFLCEGVLLNMMPRNVTGVVMYNKCMKSNSLVSENLPYYIAGIVIILGGVMLVVGRLIMEPITRDPNIGAGLCFLAGSFLILYGVGSAAGVFIVRKFSKRKNR
jgi:hypothetical protein